MPDRHILSQDREREFLQTLNALFADALRGAGREEEVLQAALDASVRTSGGKRGFLAIIKHETGELQVACTSGAGWSDVNRCLRLHLANETDRGITGHVALTGAPYLTGSVVGDPYYQRYFEDVVSEIAVPILSSQGQTRGVINVDSDMPDAFDAEDASHLSALAHCAAVALTLQGFRSRESALIETGKSLAATMEIDGLAQKVVEVASSVLQFEDCSVFLLEEQTDHLVLRASCCLFARSVGTTKFPLGEGVTGWVAQHGEPARLEDPPSDSRWIALPELPDEEVGAYLAVPIVGRDRVLGALRALRRKSHAPWFSNRFTETDERLLQTIASQLGAAIENVQSFRKLVRAERMAAWGELSARSAHMIGNRSFALKGDLNELRHILENLPGGPEKVEILQIARSMENGIGRLEEILREFRDYVMATQVSLAACDLNQLVRETVDESFPRRSAVRLHLELAEPLPPLHCDSTRLKRAFSELIENAVSFMPEGGELRITTRMLSPDDRVEYRLTPAREYAEVAFQDQGPGIPKEVKSKIFRPFYTSRVKGMGLGLSIVKGIVEAHQGLIREAGQPGKGARFLIFLPVNGG